MAAYRRAMRYTLEVPKKRSLLTHIPPPLLAELIDGRWLPIVGAGLSINAEVADPTTPLPNWEQLGRLLGAALPTGYSTNGPLETVSAYEHAYGRPRMIEAIMKALQVGTAAPGAVHKAFCSIPFETVVTTNVEELLEIEYRSSHGSVLAITEEQQLRLANLYGAPTLVKLHGDLHHPASLVLSEKDYDNFALDKPLLVTWLANQLIAKTGVLIGYSLEDADLRQILALLASRLGRSGPSLYVIEVGADPVRVDRYERRGVRVINLPRTAVGYGILAEFFSELHQYWVERFSSTLTGTTANMRALLRAGQRSENAVFFLVDDNSLSLYDEYVFPKLLDSGLLPLTVQDVSHPPEYRVATIEALVRISNQVVVDEANPAASAALNISARAGLNRILRVRSELGKVVDESPWLFELGYAPRPSDHAEWEAFGAELSTFLAQRTTRVTTGRATHWKVEGAIELGDVDPIRDTRAAVILGLIDLESQIRRHLPVAVQGTGNRSIASFRQVLLLGRQYLDIELDQESLDLLVAARNSLVHGNKAFSEAELQRLHSMITTVMVQLP